MLFNFWELFWAVQEPHHRLCPTVSDWLRVSGDRLCDIWIRNFWKIILVLSRNGQDVSPRGLNLERNWRSRLQIESPMRILYATKANGTYTEGPCIHSKCLGKNSIELGSVPKISTLIFELKLSPFHARNAFYRVKIVKFLTRQMRRTRYPLPCLSAKPF